jgi:hypothetical protein
VTIQEAIRSGKPFRRPIWEAGYSARCAAADEPFRQEFGRITRFSLAGELVYVHPDETLTSLWVTNRDILADDWETCEP